MTISINSQIYLQWYQIRLWVLLVLFSESIHFLLPLSTTIVLPIFIDICYLCLEDAHFSSSLFHLFFKEKNHFYKQGKSIFECTIRQCSSYGIYGRKEFFLLHLLSLYFEGKLDKLYLFISKLDYERACTLKNDQFYYYFKQSILFRINHQYFFF